MDRLRYNFKKYFEELTWALQETGFIARTAEMTIADVFAYSEIAQTEGLGIEWEKYPIARQWYLTVGSDPIVQQTHTLIKQMIMAGNLSISS